MIAPPVCGCQYRICDTRRTPGSIPERAPVLPEEVHPSGIHLHADGLALGEPRHPLHAGDEADAAVAAGGDGGVRLRSEEHTSELQSHSDLVCRLLLEKKKKKQKPEKIQLRHAQS